MARRFKAALPAGRENRDCPYLISGPVPVSHPDLVREIHSLIASEVRARGVQPVLSPVADAARTLSRQEVQPA